MLLSLTTAPCVPVGYHSRQIMSLLMTASMNDFLFHGRDDARPCFECNVNESG
jgi:hypothetical protein